MNLYYSDEKQRQRKRRFLKLKIYLVFSVFLFLAGGIGYLVVYSSAFRIKNINITPSESEISGKLIEDIKIFFYEQSKIAFFLGADNILIWKNKTDFFPKNYPQILRLKIKKDYFHREINIEFEEREKFGIWCPQEEFAMNCWWFDKNGIVFEKAPRVEGEIIYKIIDSSQGELSLGGRILDESLFKNLLKIFELLEKADFNSKTFRLDLALYEVQTELSPKIYFNIRIDPDFGLSALQSFKNQDLKKIEYIDLRVENRAYYRFK
ncbi:MAG: hypothetical protein UU85_C0001G0067 [Candidatus Wolfebacteria bacterium GW2011_GWA2_42_10]|uniref:POTRA domain-containing protein n=2 Tax=Candidatus Wolfeibacteriota TaxID=1752735 RepID=A0A0G0XMF9_9BACT|nr:MAG: hypothetical protein UU38_C0003G0133 [Candidatus Wolfebacteria bacterium GW2011_GWB1_41_12]KKS25637.1 MAG: hypothetical protein UU85_C0001G0067 [Candidatus Wolfebacteria bacterium GW2011_GWA2_42_10]KKT56473.1 MAG: hypothetical protein UW50_C0001G0040 [Candidatus Wolfebacteria bacterium GW2011_GWA1_44_24]